MGLTFLDWSIIIGFLVLNLGIGIFLKGKAGKDLGSFFLGNRKLPWYIAGISMVATTFAADTPLWVAEKISQHGVSGNWLWWNMLIGGMLTTFLFAKLWRRAGVLTELEFIELRYKGKAAAFLRGFRSVYMGLFLNVVIIGWVNVALGIILTQFFNIPPDEILWWIAGAMLLVAVYSSISGLMGVAITDAIQFVLAMVGCILLAYYVLKQPEVGGLSGLKERLPQWRLDLLPSIESDPDASLGDLVGKYSVTLAAFLTFALVQWWASWYPGAEPGGGGYVAQRMMSAKDEKNALLATLFFQIAHYCLRPWPWILTGLGILLIYPEITPETAGSYFIKAITDFMPHGLQGLLLVAFIGAYMSTISTQLNWGSSFITNDLYKRFLSKNKSEKQLVFTAKVVTFLIAILALFATSMMQTIDQAARFLISSGAGLGLVLILRWLWWRINAWSEISATIAPIIGYSFFELYLDMGFPYGFLANVAFTTVVWVTVTLLTQPESNETLTAFYERVKPFGNWKVVIAKNPENKKVKFLIVTMLGATVLTYGILLGTGEFLIGTMKAGFIYCGAAALGLVVLLRFLKRV